MISPNRSLIVAALVMGSLATAVAAPRPAPRPAPPRPAPAVRQVTSVEGITEYALPNGLRVLLFPDQSKETVTVNLTYLVGSRMEGYGETGMAHLLEHMLFKGSPKHPRVWDEFSAHGASNNASTWYDRTNYYETFPAKGNNLAWALELEADRMIHANIAQADLASEFSVVRNEFEIGENDAAAILSERMWSTAFLWHNYGKSTIGSRADIEKVPASSLKRFYRKYYRPDNAVLVVAGKFDPAQALRLISTHFASIRNPATRIEPTYTQEPVQDGERVVTLRRNGDVAVVGLVYHAVAAGAPEFAATDALAAILTDEPSGRLYTGLVKTGLATKVDATVLPLHDPGAIELSATVAPGKSIERVRDRMIAIVEGLGRSKITAAEVARYRTKQRKQFKLAFANSAQLGIELSEFIAAGDWRLWFLNRDRVEKLTAADVQQAAARFLIASNRTLGLFYPTKTPQRAPLEATPDVAKLVTGYKGKPPEAEGEQFAATLPNIERRTTRDTLKSGMKLAILRKQTRGHVVRARLTLRYGREADFTGHRLAASAIDQMLKRGTRKHTFQQLQDKWDELEARVSFSSTPGVLDVELQTTRDHLAEVLALVDETLRQSTFPQDQFAVVVKEALSELEEQRSDPQAQAFIAAQRAVMPYPRNHPFYVPTTDEEIKAIKALRVGELKRWPALFGTSNATMTIVGDVDVAAVKPWIERTWGSWRSPRPYQRIAHKVAAPANQDLVLDFPDKANALIVAGHGVALKDDAADAPALAAANYVLGGGGFVSRLLTRLRQKDGLSYFAFSAVQLPPLDPAGIFFAGGALNPDNAKKGMAAMLQEIGKWVATGITAAELAQAKKGLLEGFDRKLSSDGAVLDLLHDGLYLGRTTEFWAKRNAAISALSVAQVNAAIKRRFDPTKLVKIIAGDKSKMK